jgi:hypothetical protein
MSKALNDKKALNKNEMADNRANCNGDILVVGSAIATMKVRIVMIIIIITLTRIILRHCLKITETLSEYRVNLGVVSATPVIKITP